MKQFFPLKAIAIASASILFAGACLAQTPGATPGMDAVMMKLYGENKAFTASIEVSISDPTGKQNMSMPVTTIQLNGTVRSETDMEKMTGSIFPPGTMEQIKTMGMSKVISIVRPDTKDVMLIYPALSSYVQMPMPKEQLDAIKKEPKMQETEMGKETVEGHPCLKIKITTTDDNGKDQDVLVWKATDMKNFPVKMQIKMPTGSEIIIVYKSVKLEKPDTSLFTPPAGYTKFSSQQELLQKAMSSAKP